MAPFSVKGWQRFELQIDRRFLRAEQGVKIDVGDPTQGDFARLLAPDSAGQVLQFDMGVGNAFQTNIFGEMVSLLQGLVNLLLAYRVLGQLITATQQAADN